MTLAQKPRVRKSVKRGRPTVLANFATKLGKCRRCLFTYSSTSSQAGNILLISPELLVAEGLLTATDLQQHYQDDREQVNFQVAEQTKMMLLGQAWEAYKTHPPKDLKQQFIQFCEQENEWLDNTHSIAF